MTNARPFKLRTWIRFEDAAEHAKSWAIFNTKSFSLVAVEGGWQIPGLRTEQNEFGYDPYKDERESQDRRNQHELDCQIAEEKARDEEAERDFDDRWLERSGHDGIEH